MVPPSKKRKLPAASAPAPKRNKNQVAKPKPTKSAAPRIADAASLSWQPVGEEEFGGLQVISGVEVVKDGDKVQFVVKQPQPTQTQTQTQTQTDEEGAEQDGEEEPFEGFGDDAVEVQDVDSHQDHGGQDGVEGAQSGEEAAGKTKNKTKAKTKARQATTAANKALQEPAARKKDGGKDNANAFSALEGIADGEEGGDEGVDVADWVALNLSPRILSAIARLGFATPTAIQKMCIPEIVAGGDVIGKAQTGSGKTLAFGIPIVEKWLEMYEGEGEGGERREEVQKQGPMAVVLSPTRELAKQLGDHLKALCDGLPTAPYVCVVTGGLSIHKQQRQLEKADIVIGTPGRLWEVLDGDMKLQDAFTHIRFLVVDEADRLFKVGQFKEAESIIGALDRRDPEAEREDTDDDGDELPPRQTLVFSATFDKDLQTKLAGRSKSSKSHGTAEGDDDKMAYLMKCLQFRSEPRFIDVDPASRMASGLKEGLIECGAMEKDLYLYTVLLLNPNRRTLVFTNSISAVRRLTPLLANLKIAVLPLHSQMAQKARHRSLERFTASRSSVLVATDVAARGLDIHAVDQVVHYHVPRSADTYIHRSGRTARGDRGGVSIILCSPDEVISTRRLAAKVHEKRAARSGSSSKRQQDIQVLPLDRKIASRLKPRVELSKRIADAVLAKEKGHSDDQWLRGAAEELGVEYDEEEFEEVSAGGWGAGGRGGGRRRKEKAARALTKAEMGALKAQLREELGRRVNLGVSEKYITGGRVDVGALLRERENASGGMGIFLGGDGLGFEL